MTSITVSGCNALSKKDDVSASADNKILAFDEAMEDLVKGLNSLSEKEKDFGMLVDQINVKFTLAKTDKNEFGINLGANTETTSSTKFESFIVEKGSNSLTSNESSSLELFNSLVGEGSEGNGETTESKSTNKTTNSTESKVGNEFSDTNNITSSIGSKTGANVSANYSSVQTGNGENVITIQFKSLANYHNDKISALARYGKLGCLPFYIEVLGNKISDPNALSAVNSLLKDELNAGCESAITTITESPEDGAPVDITEPTPIIIE